MRPERYSYSYASNRPKRSIKSRTWLATLVMCGLILLLATSGGTSTGSSLRIGMSEIVQPLMEVVTVPVHGLRHLMENKDALFRAYEENKQLREENDTLRRWQTVAQTLKAENDGLRKLADYKPVEGIEYVAAQVIAQSPDAYAGTLMINAGAAQGLSSLQPVIDAYGLVGRLVDVGETTSRVLLLSDSTSRVPVITGNSRHHAILAGTGEELLQMTFVMGDAQEIELGEPVMTTSEGGLIPESVMVGTIFRRDGTSLLVKPLRPLAQSEYVRIMMSK